MPVSVKTAQHEASLTKAVGDTAAGHPLENLQRADPKNLARGDLLQSSFDDGFAPATTGDRDGFVNAVIEAYNNHHHLIIRPDDIWLAITTQFSSYVNAHAEDLRHAFVKHDGRKELLVVHENSTRYDVDWGNFAQQIVGLIEENIVDPELRDWILPAFSTTTLHDRITAQIVMMGTSQAYFSYTSCLLCGIPSVTLEGEQQDYERILSRLDKLCEYGEETISFCDFLRPVIRGFIDTFANPQSSSVSSFWRQICDYHRGSGTSYCSGWITVFCFWNTRGQRQLKSLGDMLDTTNIPNGFTTVPVKIIGQGLEVSAEMAAGSVAVISSSSGRPAAEHKASLGLFGGPSGAPADGMVGTIGHDTLQPQLGWFMYEKTK